MNREFAICKVMTEIGFVQGKTFPCIYRHFERHLRVWGCVEMVLTLQVASSVSSGSFQSCKSSESLPIEEFLVPLDITRECVPSIRVLGKLVEWTTEGITQVPDPRHAELIRKSFCVTVSTLGVKDRFDDIKGETPLGKEAADRYRANTMRAQYLSSDMIPTMRSTCTSVSSVITTCASVLETGTDIQCARSLRHFFPFYECSNSSVSSCRIRKRCYNRSWKRRDSSLEFRWKL